MSKDVYGDVMAALKAMRASGALGGMFGGCKLPPFQASHYYLPIWAAWDSANTNNLVANTLYRTWFPVHQTTTFLGAWCRDSGAGNNGKNVRMGLWDENGNLLKDFGAAGLTGTAGLHSIASSVTVTGPALVQVGLVSDSTPLMFCMRANSFASDVGRSPASIANAFGVISPSSPAASGQANFSVGDSASFTYGALPSTITAATATLTEGSAMPGMGLYL